MTKVARFGRVLARSLAERRVERALIAFDPLLDVRARGRGTPARGPRFLDGDPFNRGGALTALVIVPEFGLADANGLSHDVAHLGVETRARLALPELGRGAIAQISNASFVGLDVERFRLGIPEVDRDRHVAG